MPFKIYTSDMDTPTHIPTRFPYWKQMNSCEVLEETAVSNFRKYLKLGYRDPNINIIQDCVEFLEKQARELKLDITVNQLIFEKPVVVMTWKGKKPDLPSILLNSHMDVVPVYAEKWVHNPFEAVMDNNGDIYGRGAQNMKCIGMQYLEAIRRLKSENVLLRRTIHLSFMPDGETEDEKNSMALFVKSLWFQGLNVGYVLDKGTVEESNTFMVYYGERTWWKVHFEVAGSPECKGTMTNDTSGEKVKVIMEKMYKYRRNELLKLENDKDLALGEISSLNLISAKGENEKKYMLNVDVRHPPSINTENWKNMLNKWCKEAGKGVEVYCDEPRRIPLTPINNSNKFWYSFVKSMMELQLPLSAGIYPGSSSGGRHLRYLGIPVLGFSPIIKTKNLVHDHNEYINKKTFLDGIKIYTKILMLVGNVN